jgi:Ca2+-dependent lipid-binding protein
MGRLRVELLDGNEIRGVDRGGKSDPYAVFSLNGQKVYKSGTKKKTLAPEWNEVFECDVVRCSFLILDMTSFPLTLIILALPCSGRFRSRNL